MEEHPRRPGEISFESRRRIFLTGAAGLAALIVWGLTGIPDFGEVVPLYGRVLNRIGVEQVGSTDVVTGVNFNYRAFDTLGEEFILFAAVVGLGLLLRAQSDELRRRDPGDAQTGRGAPETSPAVRLSVLALAAPTALLAIYITAHGHLSPGGGFQGGVVGATALLLVYLGGNYRTMRRVAPYTLVEVTKAAGAGAFVAIGIGGLLAGGAFLESFLGPGVPGELVAGGTIPLLSTAVGLEVTGGFVLILTRFIEQLLVIGRRSG